MLKEPFEQQKMNIITIALNEKIKELQKKKKEEFSLFFLDKEASYSNEMGETVYRCNFKSIHCNFLYPYVVIDLYSRVVIEPLSKKLLKKL